MTQTLPTFRIKTKELLLLSVPCSAYDFTSAFGEYQVRQLTDSQTNVCFTNLLSLNRSEEAPYGIVADYKLLAFNDFAFVKELRKRRATAHLPIIAVGKNGENVDIRAAIQAGVDDCYKSNFQCADVRHRLEFLHHHKIEMAKLVEPPPSVFEEEKAFKIRVSPFKRLIDILGATAVLAVASPVLIATAVLIRLESKGPVIYRSKRSGTGYQVFDFLKFRSMYADADQRLKEIQHLNQYAENNSAFVKVKNDPRITRVGRFIRKTSIDELPQLINVLRGDMSLVGNRPLPLYEAEQLTKEDMAYRFLAPAGMTGLWQVSKRGGNDMSAEERMGLDITYAKKNSFWFDLKLLIKTPFAMIQKENV
jgi:lipopolysaccharide/colanic/teichoic acid biosynthesis glycosyltransferase